MRCWLIKSEPSAYSWEDLVRDGRTSWDGVRNPQARNYLQRMRRGDRCLYYHSNQGEEVAGIARVVRRAYPDPSSADPRWVAVDVAPLPTLTRRVPLSELRTHVATAAMVLVRQSRLSVCPVTTVEFRAVLKLAAAPVEP